MELNQKIIKNLLQKEDPVILELGAHVGTDTKGFLDEFKNVKLYCFEPDPRCIKQFKRSIDDDRCTLIEAAVSNQDGKTVLNISSGWPTARVPALIRSLRLTGCYLFLRRKEWNYSSSIKRSVSNPEDYPWLTFNRRVEVRTIRLDSWIGETDIDGVDFIWSDIQGAEKDMIEGAARTLKITKYFYTEYGETSSYPEAMTRDETIQIMERHNFAIIPEYSSDKKIGNLLFRNKGLAVAEKT